MRSARWLSLLMAATLGGALLAACGGGDDGPATGGEGVRTIEITAQDIRFDPDRVEVEAGETVRFVVTNEGTVPHEFVLGDEDVQMAHEERMDGMDHGEMDVGSDLPSFSLDPGETKEATVTFDEPGEVLYGCHVEGHYAAGMVGTVSVS